MSSRNCLCPYVICKVWGNCEACIAKNIAEGTMANCMEKISVEQFGAKMPYKRVPTEVPGDFEAMSKRSAELLAAHVRKKPDALLCLAAGNTAIRTYEILKEMSSHGELDFSESRFVALDEWVGLENPEGNCASFMKKYFYGPLGIDYSRVVAFDPEASDLEAECLRVDAWLATNGPIDLFLLGMGMNGHLGLNEPGVHWNRHSIVVDLDPLTAQVGQKYFKQETKLTRGITLGMKYILEAKSVILQVGEAKKAEIVRKLFDSDIEFAMPATIVRLHPDALLILDEDAASLLSTEEEKDKS
ncbi:glucosamine-6-phosphate deaminase [Treponema sp.]